MNFGNVLQEVMDHLGITEQEFMQLQQLYMSNPQTSQILMQAQLAPPDSAPPKFNKQKTKEIFLDQEEQKTQEMMKMMKQPSQHSDYNESMVDLMVMQAKMSDQMHSKYDVEEDEFTVALLHHNVMNDPEIQRIQFENMRKLGMGGGMGGMGMGGMPGMGG